MKLTFFQILLTTIFLPLALFSQDAAPPPWVFGIGVSYLGHEGNTRSHTLGGEFTFLRKATPWGIEGLIGYTRGDQDGVKTAERIRTGVKGSYKLDKRWDAFLSGSWERDRFSGFNKRLALAAGATYILWTSDRDSLLVDVGLSWNQDTPVGADHQTFLGGMADVKYTHTWSKTSSFQQKLMLVPNFAEGARWHGESETALVAGLTQKLALKGSFLLRYNHLPPDGFKKTDTTTAVSLLFSF